MPAQTAVRTGPVSKTIAQELAADGYDLLVLGTPLADLDGHISLKGVVEQVMGERHLRHAVGASTRARLRSARATWCGSSCRAVRVYSQGVMLHRNVRNLVHVQTLAFSCWSSLCSRLRAPAAAATPPAPALAAPRRRF